MERSDKIFAVTGLFNDPNKIIHAAEKTAEAGYENFDVNTPYPMHGMDRAMKLKPSKLGFVTLVFGLTGTLTILSFMWWAMSVSYPLVVGGKPFFALPAFVPITFEFTVLLAALSTVFGMIAVFFNLPKNSHPLHDTNYLKSVSIDKFGLVIQADDPQFTEAKAKDFLAGLGAENIETIYFPEEEKFQIFEPKFLWFLGIIFLIAAGSTYFTLNKLMYMVPFNWMAHQDKIRAQEQSSFFSDEFGMRTPVEGTVARGFIPYPYLGEAEPKEVLVNPLLPTKEVLELGKEKFLTYCSPCHGNHADGDSRLQGQFPNPPSLHTSRAINFPDGRIYHVITNGQNIMPSYASQITRDERWAIVYYVRALQRAKNASESDIKEVKEFSKNAQN